MTGAPPTGLATGRRTVDLAHSTATFCVANFGRTITGTAPILEGIVNIDGSGQPSAISGSLDLGALDTGNARQDKDLRKPKLLDLDRYSHHALLALSESTVTRPLLRSTRS